MSDVFISYARADRPAAKLLAAQLEHAGYLVWWDRDLLSGADFEQEIARELATARAVVVLWSAASVQSGWVRDEAGAALARRVLLPVRLDGAEVPMGFRSLHVVPFDPADARELLRAIVRLTAKAPRAPLAAVRPRPAGIGVVEGACLLAVAAAVGGFLLLMARGG